MPLSWNEIRDRAIQFTREWAGETREQAEAKSFWDAFFHVFGLKRRNVAAFEAPVRKLSGDWGHIDLFWKGMLLVEHKSFGKSLEKAQAQGMDYIQALIAQDRAHECPRYLLVTDFARFALHDLEEDSRVEFTLAEFHQYVHSFAFLAGYKAVKVRPDDPLNITAAEIMGELHDALYAGGYRGHELERFLVRVLFCLFAEDNGLFEPQSFTGYLENRTASDGSDLGLQLHRIFSVLNTPPERRQANLPEELAALPFVNGGLFAELLPHPECNLAMRNALLKCTGFNWSRISPAIFGSLFQAVMEPRERRQIGAHYTSERDILKVIRSLFLDDLRTELGTIRADRSNRRSARLREFHDKLANLRFFDPACGCGNFLVLTYRELRRLEIELLLVLHTNREELRQGTLDIQTLSRIDVDQFYGIEILEWPARIAEVALWLMDHQMNLQLSEAFGRYYIRLPLRKTATIVHGNALRLDWRTVLPPDQCSYILGNPPFVGKTFQNAGQREDLRTVFAGYRNVGDLDYVTAWFCRAAEYIARTRIRVGFVATNSLTQGELVPLLWGELFGRYRVKILFAHRTFPWESEARGKAHVHVVIIGFAAFDAPGKRIHSYGPVGEPLAVSEVANISPYLTSGSDNFVRKRTSPLLPVPPMRCGNKPADGGHLVLSPEERRELLAECPQARRLIKRYVGSEEFINGVERWCLWLHGVRPEDLRKMAPVQKRMEAVMAFREASSAEPTRKAASSPASFFYVSQPTTSYLAIPEGSSSRRRYIPIGILSADTIASNKLFIIPATDLWLFGILSSSMHMSWVSLVGGRIKSDYSYSGSMVYNTFPWPEVDKAKTARLEELAQAVLDARAQFPRATLADLYDPLTMPPALLKAHRQLDRAVERCYRKELFDSDRERVEFLFARYEQLTAPLVAAAAPRRRAR